MHRETQARRRQVHFEQRKLGQGMGTGFLVRQIDSDMGVLRELLEDVDKACREVCLSDGHLITSGFIRTHLKQHAFNTVSVREGTIRWDIELMAGRTGIGTTALTPALHHLVQEISHLKNILSNRYEIEAITLAKEEARSLSAANAADTYQEQRIAPKGLSDVLIQAVFHTTDAMLDQLLEKAKSQFLTRDSEVRRDSLKTLWDAWERLKSLEPGRDKRERTERILNKASDEPSFRERLAAEARELTNIGNNFMIRHAEVDKVPIIDEEHVDYLFHRTFAMIRLLLRKSNRGG
jgi:hypothetical protein